MESFRQFRCAGVTIKLADYLIVANEKPAADPMVKTADQAGVDMTVLLNRVPNNRMAGPDIAKLVTDKALHRIQFAAQ